MDFSFIIIQTLNGLATASYLFIAASGLTIVFGVTRIVNFAHGSLFMIAAYLAVTLMPRFLDIQSSFWSFLVAAITVALLVGVLAMLLEVLLLRRIYKAPELFQLLATFGVVLIVQDLVIMVWGPEDILGPRVPGLASFVEIQGQRFPAYELFLIGLGPLVLGLLWLLFHKTRFGIVVRAATVDREIASTLGINPAVLFTATLFLSGCLAGLAGAIQVPREPANGFMDINLIAEAFVITVIGGLGSITGAFIAAVLIGLLQAFGIVIFPKVTLVLVFALMAIILIWRPKGLLGREVRLAAEEKAMPSRFPPFGGYRWLLLFGLAGVLALSPAFVDDFFLRVLTEVLVLGLFALSLNLLLGLGGITSFGHAAYFGLGAYGAAMLTKYMAIPMEAGLAFSGVVAAIGAAALGAVLMRLSGIYLAMLTLAFAQILYAIAFQWIEVTGGDNGILGVWPSQWASEPATFFYLSLACVLLVVAAIYNLMQSPFGFALRAARDSDMRAAALGIHVKLHRWLAFTIAGAAAGFAGGLYVYSRGNIDPTALSIPISVDALTMSLLGGIYTYFGPLLGAAVLHLAKDFVMPLTDFWRFWLGCGIILMVLLRPGGLLSGPGLGSVIGFFRPSSDPKLKSERTV